MLELGRKRESTLAELLGSLGAGGPCPCCGDLLQSGRSGLSATTLVCRSCGCEVETEPWPLRAVSSEGWLAA